MRRLSPEIVSLIHHVELNESGWWKKAVAQVVRGVLWTNHGAMTLAELQSAFTRELGIQLANEVIAKQLDTLIGQGVVVPLHGQYKLTEHARQELSKAHEAASLEQSACRSVFATACALHCPQLDEEMVWTQFTKALVSAIHVTGANLYHLLVDGNLQRDIDWLSKLLSNFDNQHHEGLRKVLSAFFSPGNHACRNQVLRLLSAHFFAEAAQLRPETLAIIEGERKARSIKVVLDTNFIFSVLGLHDNPGDDAASSLIEIAKKSGHKLTLRFYVLPSTLDEAQRVLISQMHNVERIRTTAAMARVALTQPLPSIAKKFFDAAARAPGLTAAAFFQPYIDDLRTILDGKGIAILDAHPGVYHQRQDVIDDVLDEQRREVNELPEKKRKGYETLLHDAVLWHAVKDRRPAHTDSPFEVEYWAVSIDWRLIGFDRKKRKENASKLPVVLHPSNLVQLVQFWIPRSQELAESLVDSFRLPLFFQTFDPEDERATVKVLEAISRFENVSDFPERTLELVLANKVLRGRLRDADASNDEVFDLVREELVSEHKQVIDELEVAKGTLRSVEDAVVAERLIRGRVELEKVAAEDQLRQANERAEAEAAARRTLQEQLNKDTNELQNKLFEKDRDLERVRCREARRSYALYFIIVPLIFGLVLAYWGYLQIPKWIPGFSGGWKLKLFLIGIGILPLSISFVLSPFYADKREHLSNWWLVRAVAFLGRKVLLAPLMLLLSSIFSGASWDYVKAATGFNP